MGASPAVAADPDVVSCTLTPRHDSVRHAREFTRSTLRRWGLDALFDDVALVASELVTNALRHGVGLQMPGSAPPTPGTLPIRLSLVRREPQVVCAVSDPSSAGPVARKPGCLDFESESGRGLQLVASFSQSWGWHPVAAGKVVWALFMDPSHAGG
ncbi:ATP-binding protein [Phaeacidiphilus oryzae]|jgi:anti-sigma regulatory factor (Ser/Thr protein kinase)|uniref:ATP-binding protein n=1 Tax=Phaeacidiphilus oryzae TaxID=348818 RepID=UPI00068CCB89|nr:ATP-binding protein [Phaeacidiphilus oryzae]